MYRIDTGAKQINGARVNTFIRAITAGDQLYEAEAGTTGYQGGGRQSGSRCYLRLSALTKADFFARVRESESGQPIGVEICFSGDDGLTALMKALTFASDVIHEQSTGLNT